MPIGERTSDDRVHVRREAVPRQTRAPSYVVGCVAVAVRPHQRPPGPEGLGANRGVSMSSGCPYSRRRPALRLSSRRLRCDARSSSARSPVTAPRLAGCREDGAGVLSRRVCRPDAVLPHERVGQDEELPHDGRQGDFGGFPLATSASYFRLRSGLCWTATIAGM